MEEERLISDEADNQQQQQHDSFSKYREPYWKSRLTVGLFAVIFLEFIFFFGYFPYTIYFLEMISISKSTDSIYYSIVLFIFHFIFITCQFSLYKTTFTDPGSIPKGFPDSSIYQGYDIQFHELNSTGDKRRCIKCASYKPDRAHHCSKCKKCILKMDHHCPFVNNCVGYYNYKFFVLFLGWSTILCFYIMFTTANNFIFLLDPKKNRNPNVFLGIIFILGLLFGIGLSFFTGTHIKYILFNETTIEHFEKNSPNSNRPSVAKQDGVNIKNRYDINYTYNLKTVFGDSFWRGILPVQNPITPISGLVFYTNNQVQQQQHHYHQPQNQTII